MCLTSEQVLTPRQERKRHARGIGHPWLSISAPIQVMCNSFKVPEPSKFTPDPQIDFTMHVAWDRLIRFEATDGRTLRGQPILPTPDFDLGTTTEATQLKANIIKGDDIYSVSGDTVVTDEVVTVKKLLGPLAADEIPILRCVGLNYATHSEIQSVTIILVWI